MPAIKIGYFPYKGDFNANLKDARTKLTGFAKLDRLVGLIPIERPDTPPRWLLTFDPASFAGLPAISLPSDLSTAGLPLAVQLIAGPFAEAALLSAAAWTEALLDFTARPPVARDD